MFICSYVFILIEGWKVKIEKKERADQTLSFTTEQQQYYRNKLLQIKDFEDAFELVKIAVDAKFKMHRAGLSLILQGLPTNLGAYHILGSNMIIINRRILHLIKMRKSHEEYNSFVFMVLAHEYLHSFGIVDELHVRNMTHDLCKSLFGEDHLASIMARYEPWAVFPELNLYPEGENKFEKNFEIIKNFDRTTQSHIY
jgi:hypothetical protein